MIKNHWCFDFNYISQNRLQGKISQARPQPTARWEWKEISYTCTRACTQHTHSLSLSLLRRELKSVLICKLKENEQNTYKSELHFKFPLSCPYSLISHKQTLLASTGFLLNKGKKIKATDYSVTTNYARNFMLEV